VVHDIQGHELVYCLCYVERKGKRSCAELRSVHTPASREQLAVTELSDAGSWWQQTAEEECPVWGNLKTITDAWYDDPGYPRSYAVSAREECFCLGYWTLKLKEI
jgi:hypothetical protein